MVRIKNAVYVLEVAGEPRDCFNEERLYTYLSDFKKSEVDIFQVGDTYVLNNLNNTVAFIEKLAETNDLY